MAVQKGIAKIIIPKSLTNDQFAKIEDNYVKHLLFNMMYNVKVHLAVDYNNTKNITIETVLLYLRAMSRNCTHCGKSSEFEGFSQWVRPRYKYFFTRHVELHGPAFHCSNCCYDFKEGRFRSDEFARVFEVKGDNLVFYRYDFDKNKKYVFELNGNKFPMCGNKFNIERLRRLNRGKWIHPFELSGLLKRHK